MEEISEFRADEWNMSYHSGVPLSYSSGEQSDAEELTKRIKAARVKVSKCTKEKLRTKTKAEF